MPLIKRFDTLACELLSEEEVILVNTNTNTEKKDDNKKENSENTKRDMKVDEVVELIIFT